MELIREVIEWAADDIINVLATVFPYLVIGLLGLYLLWLLVGYLRVSQVGIAEAHGTREVVALPRTSDTAALPTAPRGVPYCATDGLQYPAGATFCTKCERDLSLDCANCGATLAAAAASCYRCGTRTGAAEPDLLG